MTTEETPDFQPEGETAELLRAFRYDHLPPHLQAASKPWCDLAHDLVRRTPPGRWLVMSLEHLMIAKDAAVRASLSKP